MPQCHHWVHPGSPARGRTTPDKVVKAADKALYRAKDEGRNRVKRFSYFW